ncbi:hypothetical protein [Methylobacterium nodulans]|uniref:Uncharacterized protein n=1 Tax=Methylobacterium nodulans (strain LMG 21967 / CNCM I-2342 / ORS 2060) TaxID=460265 RepID=B8IA52_METNO|nr:hypothetical protein [Methylobacterium nodulans]ACL59115.1 hypothetical protein Mnod_4239 [Methylobacterium nodulans ORS 2060]
MRLALRLAALDRRCRAAAQIAARAGLLVVIAASFAAIGRWL